MSHLQIIIYCKVSSAFSVKSFHALFAFILNQHEYTYKQTITEKEFILRSIWFGQPFLMLHSKH